MPSFGSSGSIDVWTTGTWTSQLCDLSLANVNSNTRWNRLKWKEDQTSDSSQAYIKVDILDSSDTVLQSDLEGSDSGGYKVINLDYNNVKSVDIKIRFKLYSLGISPIISDIQLN
jgi:hypothetical protein